MQHRSVWLCAKANRRSMLCLSLSLRFQGVLVRITCLDRYRWFEELLNYFTSGLEDVKRFLKDRAK